MKYRFSQQQIIGINYYYSKIVEGTFEEDHIRLLLIHLREFLRNADNKDARSRENTNLLMEIGDGIAHTIRDTLMPNGKIRPSIIHQKLATLVQILGSKGGHTDWNGIPFTLFDLNEIIDVLKSTLTDTGVLYNSKGIGVVFKSESADLKMCLMAMLNGMLFKVHYAGIPNDFYVEEGAEKHFVHIRTELDLDYVTSLRQLRLNAWMPLYGGGKFGQRILCYELPESGKVDVAALKRTGSNEGYCEPIKALRSSGRLVITTIPTGVPSVEVYKVFRASSYDTHPISKGVPLTKIE